MSQESIELTADDLVRLAFPEPIKCAAECEHGCDIPMEPGQSRVKVAIGHGWTIVSWKHPSADHDLHSVYFCQPQCHYEWLKARMLAEPRYVPLLPEMDARAGHLAADILRHQHHRGGH